MSQDHVNSSKQPIVVHAHPPVAEGCLLGCFGFLAKIVLAFVVLAIFVGTIAHFSGSGLEKSVVEKHFDGSETSKNKIVIISLSGLIVGDHEGSFLKQLKAAEEDPQVKAVVLRINSPGGTITGSDFYHHKVQQFKERKGVPIVTSMGDMAASGGYYLAVTGQEIFAERTTITGSIGVIAGLYDLSELCEKIGVRSNSITSGPFKSMGDPTRKMTDEERALFQKMVDEMFARFKEVVREGRPIFQQNPEKLDALATGQIYSASEAVENDLIDKIGFLEDAAHRAAELANLSKGDYRVVRYSSPRTMMDILFDNRAKQPEISSLLSPKLVNDLTTPKLYYVLPRALPLVNPE